MLYGSRSRPLTSPGRLAGSSQVVKVSSTPTNSASNFDAKICVTKYRIHKVTNNVVISFRLVVFYKKMVVYFMLCCVIFLQLMFHVMLCYVVLCCIVLCRVSACFLTPFFFVEVLCCLCSVFLLRTHKYTMFYFYFYWLFLLLRLMCHCYSRTTWGVRYSPFYLTRGSRTLDDPRTM